MSPRQRLLLLLLLGVGGQFGWFYRCEVDADADVCEGVGCFPCVLAVWMGSRGRRRFAGVLYAWFEDCDVIALNSVFRGGRTVGIAEDVAIEEGWRVFAFEPSWKTKAVSE